MANATGFDGNGSSNGAHGSPGDTFQHAKVMVDEARAFGRSLSEQAQTLGAAVDLRGRVQRNPLAMIAVGVGVGYLLGGGLFTPLTGRLVRFGLRAAILPLLKGPLAAMAGGASIAGMGGGLGDEPGEA